MASSCSRSVSDRSVGNRLLRMTFGGWGVLLLGAVLCFSSRANAEEPAKASKTQTPLRWAADSEGGAPYIFKSPDNPNVNIGFEVELVAALSRELGRPIEFVQYDFKSLLQGLGRGDFDFAMNGLEVTPDRLRQVRFTKPYYRYRQQLIVRTEETRIQSFDDCARLPGIVVGTMDDTAADRLLDARSIAKRVYDNQTEPFEDLALGRTDAVLLDAPIAQYMAGSNPKLKRAGEGVEPGDYAIAVRPGDRALAEALDAALAKVIDSGELRTIYEKWSLWNEEQAALKEHHVSDILAESAKKWTPAVYLPELFRAALVTLEVSFKSMAVAMVLGLIVALARLFGPAPIRWLALIYVEFFRGIPVLLLLVFIYFGLPSALEASGMDAVLGTWGRLDPISASILAFGLNYAAFEAEIYRAGISAVPPGQWEAAASLGMRPPLAFRRIILPQALRTILPPSTNDFVALFKDTSLVSVVSVIELTKQYQILAKSSLKYLEIGLATALLYLLMSIPLGWLSRRMEARWRGA
jgi:polar amino acid transport system substrate-binding protein